MGLSKFSQLRLADFVRGTNFPASSAGLFLALSSTDPLADGSGLSEPTDASYARKPITPSSIQTTTNETFITNSAPILFGPWAADQVGSIGYAAVIDSNGQILMSAQLGGQRKPLQGDTVSFAADVIKIALKQFYGSYLATQFFKYLLNQTPDAAPVEVFYGLSHNVVYHNGSNLSEPPATDGYARQSIEFEAPSLNGYTVLTNADPVIFGPAVDNNWANVQYGFVATASLNGNILLQGPLSDAKNLLVGNSFPLAVSSTTLKFS